jgi:methylglutamate dehydrogenase subunit D
MLKERGCVSDLVKDVKTKSGAAISERTDVAVTHIAARRGAQTSLDDLARATFGTSFPSTPRAVEAAGVMIVWAGPDQWLIIQRQEAGVDLSSQLAKTFNGLASVFDVTDSRTIFRIPASHPSDALSRSMGIDFHDAAFRPGDVAITHVAHLGTIVWRLPDGSGYDFACARTYSRDFLDWLRKV